MTLPFNELTLNGNLELAEGKTLKDGGGRATWGICNQRPQDGVFTIPSAGIFCQVCEVAAVYASWGILCELDGFSCIN